MAAMILGPATCRPDSCKCFCHVSGKPEGSCCGRITAIEKQLRDVLIAVRRAKRSAQEQHERRRLSACIICLEDAIDKLRGGE